VLLFDTSGSMQIKDPRLTPEDQKRAEIGKDLLDPAKGLAQALDRNRLNEVEQVARMDLLKDILKNGRLNLLPRLDKEFDLDAFSFGQGLAPILARKDADTNASPKQAPPAGRLEQFTWVDRLGATNPATAIGDAL